MEDTLLTVRDVAKLLNSSPSTVWRLVKQGELPTVRYLGAVRFEVEAVRLFVKGKTERAGG